MQGLLYAIAISIVGSLVARVLIGSGLTLVAYAGISTAVESLLDSAVAGLGTLGDVSQILYIAGVGDALSIVGGAVVASVTFHAARVFVARA